MSYLSRIMRWLSENLPTILTVARDSNQHCPAFGCSPIQVAIIHSSVETIADSWIKVLWSIPMSFIKRVDPEIVHALEFNTPERFIAIGDDPPRAREITNAQKQALFATLPPTEVTIEERSIAGAGWRNPHRHLSAAKSGATRGTALAAWRRLHRWHSARRCARHRLRRACGLYRRIRGIPPGA